MTTSNPSQLSGTKKPAPRWLFCLLLSSVLLSCSSTKINPPGPETPTLLVLPVNSSNTSKMPQFGFSYVYRFVNLDDPEIHATVEIRLPIKAGYKVIDTLPPGDYALEHYSIEPVGRATHSYDDNRFYRYDLFRLEAGKVTIFGRSLNIRKENDPKGKADINSVTYKSLDPTTSLQRQKIIASLKTLPNLSRWEFATPDASNPIGPEKLLGLIEQVPQVQQKRQQTESERKQKVYLVGMDLSGRYRSRITSSSLYAFKKAHRDIEVSLEHRGDRITGSDDSGRLQITGTIDGDVIRFVVTPSILTGYYDVTGEWLINDDGTLLEGLWRDSRGDDPGTWDLIKIR